MLASLSKFFFKVIDKLVLCNYDFLSKYRVLKINKPLKKNNVKQK